MCAKYCRNLIHTYGVDDLDQFHVDELEVSGSFCPFTQGRYYRTVSGTTATTHAVLPLRPVVQVFDTATLQVGSWRHPVLPDVARYYRASSCGTTAPPGTSSFRYSYFGRGSWCRPALPGPPGSTGARYYRVRPVVPLFFLRHYRGLPVVQVLLAELLLVLPSTTGHRAVLPLTRYYRMRTVVLWAGSACRSLAGRYYRTPCGSTGVSDFLPNGWISCGLLYKLQCSTPRGSSPSIKDTLQDPFQELTKSIITPNPSNQTRRSLED